MHTTAPNPPGGPLSEKRGDLLRHGASLCCDPSLLAACASHSGRDLLSRCGRRAVGRVSFSSRRYARLPSPEFTCSPSAVHGCAGRAPHAAVHGNGHARVFMEAYAVREPFISYDDGVCSRSTNPMDPFASADCMCRHRVASCADPPCSKVLKPDTVFTSQPNRPLSSI